MNLDRRVFKYGGLQTKVCKKGGTLIRKKKYVYEEEQWVALCVHNEKIPFLEWYPTAEEIRKHEPVKVMDLLFCSFVNVSIIDDRCFVIGFSDENRSALEFAARSGEDAKNWREEITNCLKRLECLTNTDNEYQTIPVQQQEQKRLDTPPPPIKQTKQPSPNPPRRLNLSDEIPLPYSTAPTLTNESTIMSRLPHSNPIFVPKRSSLPEQSPPSSPPLSPNIQRLLATSPTLRRHASNSFSDTISEVQPPKLPPRKNPNLMIPWPVSPTDSDKVPNVHRYDFPLTPPAIPRHCENFDEVKKRSPTTKMILSRSNGHGNDFSESEISRLSQELIQLRMSSASSSTTEDSNDSTKSQPGEYSLLTPPPRPPKNLTLSSGHLNYAGSFRESKAATKTISLLLSICMEHIAFAEVAGNVWIAGWNEEKDALLKNLIHFGDEIFEVNGKSIRGLKNFHDLLHENHTPAVPITFKIRTIPHGSTYLIKKPFDIYTNRTFGIIFHKKKNRIEEIVPLSKAAKTGIPAKMTPFLYGRTEVAAVITEIDGIPMNLFATNEQFYKRLEKIPNGNEIKIVVQPHDFVKLIKQQLKTLKSLKRFLHEY